MGYRGCFLEPKASKFFFRPLKDTLYPQYQVYKHHLISFIDRLWPILLHQNEVILERTGLFCSKNGDILICAFFGIHLHIWLPNDDPFTEHKKFSNNCKFISLFKDVNHFSRIEYHGSLMTIKTLCYNQGFFSYF